ncbi:hypothetical protein ACFX15_034349 [Malus domestica]
MDQKIRNFRCIGNGRHILLKICYRSCAQVHIVNLRFSSTSAKRTSFSAKKLMSRSYLAAVLDVKTLASTLMISSTGARNEVKESVFTARDCDSTHRMIISKFLFSLT